MFDPERQLLMRSGKLGSVFTISPGEVKAILARNEELTSDIVGWLNFPKEIPYTWAIGVPEALKIDRLLTDYPDIWEISQVLGAIVREAIDDGDFTYLDDLDEGSWTAREIKELAASLDKSEALFFAIAAKYGLGRTADFLLLFYEGFFPSQLDYAGQYVSRRLDAGADLLEAIDLHKLTDILFQGRYVAIPQNGGWHVFANPAN